MENSSKFYMVKKKALPEILLKVAEANALLNRGKARTIKEAIDAVGISRSSYYKYKDDIFPIHEKIQGKTITFVMEMEDRPGLLSSILKVVADCKANILSIHQSIPVNHIALITLSVMILPITDDVAELFDRIENADGINNLKIRKMNKEDKDDKCSGVRTWHDWFRCSRSTADQCRSHCKESRRGHCRKIYFGFERFSGRSECG